MPGQRLTQIVKYGTQSLLIHKIFQHTQQTGIHFMGAIQKFRHHLWDDNTKRALRDWLNVVFSLSGIWCFIPAILGIFFVYWAEYNAQYLILKEYHEILAICLMSIAVVLFL